MREFLDLLRRNRNYRYMWMGQVVSEIGDNFNNIAVFALAMQLTHSGLVVMGVMLSRAIPAITIGPLAGVMLDRFDRKRIMIASDLTRAVVALGFILALRQQQVWLLYTFSALLMIASPFFTAGRSAILPTIANEDEIHTANSLTQTTQWTNLTIGTFLGATVVGIGYEWAFTFNALSFLFSAWAIWKLREPHGKKFRADHRDLTEAEVVRPWHEYREGLRYMRSVPLVLAIALLAVGWATGGGAAQILFTLFGEVVFNRGAAGIGTIWGFAGIGLLVGGTFANWLGKRLSFEEYKLAVFVDYLVHGGAYVLFSRTPQFELALLYHSRVARRHCHEFDPELLVFAQDGFRPISRPRLCHDRNTHVVDDDALHGRGGDCLNALQPANDRSCSGLAQFDHCNFLGMGELDRPAAIARSVRRGNERSGDTRRPGSVTKDRNVVTSQELRARFRPAASCGTLNCYEAVQESRRAVSC